MFSADLISPEDVKKMAQFDPTIVEFDLSGFKFISIKPVEFKLVATQINKARRLSFLQAWQAPLYHNTIPIPFPVINKISEYLDEEDYRPLKILNKL